MASEEEIEQRLDEIEDELDLEWSDKEQAERNIYDLEGERDDLRSELEELRKHKEENNGK